MVNCFIMRLARCFVRVKTNARGMLLSRKISVSSARLSACSTKSTFCSILPEIEAAGVISTLAGSLSMVEARSAISADIVAEKNSVCLFLGSVATMRCTSRTKPMSSMRSASSSTSTSTQSKRRCFLLCKSSRRPGVATKISGILRSALICGCAATPPRTTVLRSFRWRP